MPHAIIRKRELQRDHALRRAKERYGVRLSCVDYERLVAQITNGEAPELERLPDGSFVHLVHHNQVTMPAVYHEWMQTITTFLVKAAPKRVRFI